MKSSILFLGVIALISLCYIFLCNMTGYQRLSKEDMMYSYSFSLREDLARYAKNINRYSLYYGGARFEEEQTITEADAEEYKAKLLGRLVEEETNLDETYRERMIEGYLTDDTVDYAPGEFGVTYGSDRYGDYIVRSDQEPIFRVNVKLYEEKAKALEAIRSQYNISHEQMAEEILAEKNQNYAEIKKYLKDEDTFQYYLFNPTDLRVYSNIPGLNVNIVNHYDDLQETNAYAEEYGASFCYFVFNLEDRILQENYFNGASLAESFAENGFQGFIFMPYGTTRVNDLQNFSRQADLFHGYSIIAFTASLILLIALLVFCFTGRLKSFLTGNAYLYRLYQKQPFFMKAGIGGSLCLLLLANLFWAPEIFRYFSYSFMGGISRLLLVFGLYFVCALYLVLSLEYGIITLRSVKSLKQEPEMRLAGRLKQDVLWVLQTKNRVLALFYAAFLLLGAAGTLLAAFTVIFYMDRDEAGIVLVVLLCYCAVFLISRTVYRFMVGYARLTNAIHSMAGGGFEPIEPGKGVFAEPLTELAGLEDSLKKSVEEAVKSQRLKAELITNVSHDLKTPLTSIINYVDLLKKNADSVGDQVAQEYIEVLEKKSQRLKVLIEDLFEASKLNSGSAELVPELVDLADLLKQALGELSEQIEASGIVFRVQYAKEHIFAYVDGKKIWRVFENLLGNILKYSPPNSRAYLSIEEEENGMVELVFKNVSAYEIDFDPVELFERFKRGDASRSTEGSGLGLSIARSIVELHDGHMEIIVDGDLFKVTVRLPLSV